MFENVREDIRVGAAWHNIEFVPANNTAVGMPARILLHDTILGPVRK